MIYYKKKIQQDVGATAVEYGILSALIAVVTILGLQATGTNLGTTYCTIANQLSQAVGAGATASGCSATSSSSSSSSADSSGSDSSSSSSSADGSGSDSSASSSTPATYDASNSYTVSDTNKYDNLQNLLLDNISAMSGIYDSQGNEITTPEEYAEAIGVTSDTFQKVANAWVGSPPSGNSNAPELVSVLNGGVADEMKAEITAAGKTIYMPTLDNVTFTAKSGATATNNGTIYSDPSDHMWAWQGHNLYYQILDAPTGNGN